MKNKLYFIRPMMIVLWAVFVLPATGLSSESNRPFQPGEKLTFNLKWGNIPAGEAVFEILPMETFGGIPSYHFAVTARTNDFVDTIYKVRNRIESYVDEDMTHSLLYKKKQREGKHKRDVEVNFDWAKGEVRYTHSGKQRNPVPVPPGTFDPLSVFYAFRLHELREDSEIETSVTDGKRCTIGKAKVIGRERIKVASGEYDTYLVEPDLSDLSGIFNKSKNAKLQIWVTADERRLPVKVRSQVVVGHFTGELVSVSYP